VLHIVQRSGPPTGEVIVGVVIPRDQERNLAGDGTGAFQPAMARRLTRCRLTILTFTREVWALLPSPGPDVRARLTPSGTPTRPPGASERSDRRSCDLAFAWALLTPSHRSRERE
jgi:hypothetical protein